MTQVDSRYLDAFPQWLGTLRDDAVGVSALLGRTELAAPARTSLAGAINYLFKSLDLIQDGIEDLGFLDDAFVFRVAAVHALASDPTVATKDESGVVKRLAEECDLVRGFLAEDYPRLERFVRGLRESAVRGRAPESIVSDRAVRDALLSDVAGWAASFEAPKFGREEKNLVKLRSFLGAKLPT